MKLLICIIIFTLYINETDLLPSTPINENSDAKSVEYYIINESMNYFNNEVNKLDEGWKDALFRGALGAGLGYLGGGGLQKHMKTKHFTAFGARDPT